MPSAEEIATFYPSDYYSLNSSEESIMTRMRDRALEAAYRTNQKWNGSVRDFIFTQIAKFFLEGLPLCHYGDRSFLDVGCGNGMYMVLMKRFGWECSGFDINPSSDTIVSDHIVVAKDLATAAFDKQFAYIRVAHVLEHVPNPGKFLDTIAALLAPDGQVVFGLPNSRSAYARAFGRYWYNRDIPRHVINYDAHSLPSILEKHGLKVEHVHYRSFGGLVGSLQHFSSQFRPEISLMNKFWLLMPFRVIDILMDLLDLGDCVVVSARLKVQ